MLTRGVLELVKEDEFKSRYIDIDTKLNRKNLRLLKNIIESFLARLRWFCTVYNHVTLELD